MNEKETNEVIVVINDSTRVSERKEWTESWSKSPLNIECQLFHDINGPHWSGSNVEFEKITQANNLYGCLGIGLRYSEILEFKSKDGGFPNNDHIRFLFYEKIRPRTLK